MKTNLFESNQIEFKETFDEKTEPAIYKSIYAFNNTNGGKIYIGIKDDRTIVGVDKNDIDRISKSISNHINDIKRQNSIHIEYETYEGKNIIVIVIFSSDKLWTNKNELIIRCGTSNRSLTNKELEQYLLKIDKYNEKLNNRFKTDFNLLGFVDWNFFDEQKINKMEKIYSRLIEIKSSYWENDNIEILDINNFSFFNNVIYLDVHLGYIFVYGILPNKYSYILYLGTIRLKITEHFIFEYEKRFFNKMSNIKYSKDNVVESIDLYGNVNSKKNDFDNNFEENYKDYIMSIFTKDL